MHRPGQSAHQTRSVAEAQIVCGVLNRKVGVANASSGGAKSGFSGAIPHPHWTIDWQMMFACYCSRSAVGRCIRFLLQSSTS